MKSWRAREQGIKYFFDVLRNEVKEGYYQTLINNTEYCEDDLTLCALA